MDTLEKCNLYRQFGHWCEKKRRETWRTQEDFADKLGVSVSTYCRIEKGTGSVTLPQFVILIRELHFTKEETFTACKLFLDEVAGDEK